jgi:hypothetical protein
LCCVEYYGSDPDFIAIVGHYRRLLRSRSYVGFVLVAAFGFSRLFAFLAGSAFVFAPRLREPAYRAPQGNARQSMMRRRRRSAITSAS